MSYLERLFCLIFICPCSCRWFSLKILCPMVDDWISNESSWWQSTLLAWDMFISGCMIVASMIALIVDYFLTVDMVR